MFHLNLYYTMRIVIVRACESPFRHIKKYGNYTLRIVTARACERPDQQTGKVGLFSFCVCVPCTATLRFGDCVASARCTTYAGAFSAIYVI